jgi:cbb3-type cytochrome oxidase subunit 3
MDISAIFSAIIGLLFLLVICYICFKYSGRRKQQQQQQQQIVVQTGDRDKKMRVCPKCGMQNEVTNKFCSDCAYEFKKQNDKST